MGLLPAGSNALSPLGTGFPVSHEKWCLLMIQPPGFLSLQGPTVACWCNTRRTSLSQSGTGFLQKHSFLSGFHQKQAEDLNLGCLGSHINQISTACSRRRRPHDAEPAMTMHTWGIVHDEVDSGVKSVWIWQGACLMDGRRLHRVLKLRTTSHKLHGVTMSSAAQYMHRRCKRRETSELSNSHNTQTSAGSPCCEGRSGRSVLSCKVNFK